MGGLDLAGVSLREAHRRLHAITYESYDLEWRLTDPWSAHAIDISLDAPLSRTIQSHVGFYCDRPRPAGLALVLNI